MNEGIKTDQLQNGNGLKRGDKFLFNFKNKDRLFITMVLTEFDEELDDFVLEEESREGEIDLCSSKPYINLFNEIISSCVKIKQ